MKSLKLNLAETNMLDEKQKAAINGGGACQCACRYANSGGSSTHNNGVANSKGGLQSKNFFGHYWNWPGDYYHDYVVPTPPTDTIPGEDDMTSIAKLDLD